MAIEAIHSFLVTPAKNVDKTSEIGGAALPLVGKLFDMLAGVYAKSEKECRFDIAFNPPVNGTCSFSLTDTIGRLITEGNVDYHLKA